MELPQLHRDDDDRLEIEPFRRPARLLSFPSRLSSVSLMAKMQYLRERVPYDAAVYERLICDAYDAEIANGTKG